MSISYYSSYNGIIYNRTSNSTYSIPSNILGIESDIAVYDKATGNIYAYQWSENLSSGSLERLSGFGWTGDVSKYKYPSTQIAYHSLNFSINDLSANNIVLGAYSAALGIDLITYHETEIALGKANVAGWLYNENFEDIDDRTIFTIGNGVIDYNTSSGTTFSNALTISENRFILNNHAYIGYNLMQTVRERSSDYAYRVLMYPIENGALYVHGSSYVDTSYVDTGHISTLNVSGSSYLNVSYNDVLFISDDQYPVLKATDFTPTKLHNTGTGSDGKQYNFTISESDWQNRLKRFEARYTMDWLDYYEMMFRDTIVFFKCIENNASRVKEYSLFNETDYNQCLSYLRQEGIFTNPGKAGFHLTECDPVWVTNLWAENRPGKFQIKVSWDVVNAGTKYTIYLRPCKNVYKIISVFAGDVDFWFKERAINVNVNGRWSPITQYQDADLTTDSVLSRNYRTQNQIFFCTDEQKYYRIDPTTNEMVEVELNSHSLS
jgi:hypothetical protein